MNRTPTLIHSMFLAVAGHAGRSWRCLSPMCAHQAPEPLSAGSSIESWLTWVGGGERRELHERHERSAHLVAGVIVLLNAALTWLVTTLAVTEAVRVPALAVVPFTLVFALLVGAMTRAIATGPTRGRAGRLVAAVAVGLVLGGCVGEFGALALFSGAIDHRLQEQAARNAVSAPAVVQASSTLQRTRDARGALDLTVDTARTHRDEALVVARCEYHPTPACPQTRITGVPGSGPETRTANELLADSQRELNDAVTARDREAPKLDTQIVGEERELAAARQSATTNADHGLGARWVAMQELTSANAGALVLRLMTIGFFIVLTLLPLILRLWRGETTHDRHAQARAEVERAELEADTAIAVKRAEVRAAAETMWAEQQLAQARLAVEAQTEIDRAQLERRVRAEVEDNTHVAEPVVEDIYLPIAAEAEAASLAAAESVEVIETPNLPAAVEEHDVPAAQTIPTLPDVTRAAARWIRPLVPGFVARAIDTSTHPLRTARQVIEEVEEITFALKRTRKVTIETEEAVAASGSAPQDRESDVDRVAGQTLSPHRLSAAQADDLSLTPGRYPRQELTEREGPTQLRAADGPRQLPPAE
jgi:hypothetical protein